MKRVANIIRKGMILGGLALGLGASSAEASSPVGFWTFTRDVTPGTYYAVMTDVSTTTCHLSKVQMSELRSPGNAARCEILRQNGRWVLETSLNAATSGGNAARVSCSASCFND